MPEVEHNIWFRKGKYWFSDETQDFVGPFDTQEEAKAAFIEYIKLEINPYED